MCISLCVKWNNIPKYATNDLQSEEEESKILLAQFKSSYNLPISFSHSLIRYCTDNVIRGALGAVNLYAETMLYWQSEEFIFLH